MIKNSQKHDNRKTKCLHGIFFKTVILLDITGIISGQTAPVSIDPEREVIVMFKSGAVGPPEGRTAGGLEEFQIPEQALKHVLLNANVEAISRLIPDFLPEDKYGVSRTGEEIQLTDWTNVYVIRIPQSQARNGFLNALKKRSEVIFAEPHGRGEPNLIPNDYRFYRQWALKNDGTSIQGGGTAGADINAIAAWEITTGSSNVKIGIVDSGMQTDHPDFTGRVTGDAGDDGPHGTVVAGIAAATGNNSIGVAGVAWNVGIINEDYGSGSDANMAAAVRSAANRGADIINNSWKILPVGRYSTAVRLAFADVYKLNRVSVAAMGNQYKTLGENAVEYPAAFGQGIITVGATTNTDDKADYSSTRTGGKRDVCLYSSG
ncbi:MAG: S8 family serine peptidase [Fidelibacterota bacterium]